MTSNIRKDNENKYYFRDVVEVVINSKIWKTVMRSATLVKDLRLFLNKDYVVFLIFEN